MGQRSTVTEFAFSIISVYSSSILTADASKGRRVFFVARKRIFRLKECKYLLCVHPKCNGIRTDLSFTCYMYFMDSSIFCRV